MAYQSALHGVAVVGRHAGQHAVEVFQHRPHAQPARADLEAAQGALVALPRF
jgi:hypothetical protein